MNNITTIRDLVYLFSEEEGPCYTKTKSDIPSYKIPFNNFLKTIIYNRIKSDVCCSDSFEFNWNLTINKATGEEKIRIRWDGEKPIKGLFGIIRKEKSTGLLDLTLDELKSYYREININKLGI